MKRTYILLFLIVSFISFSGFTWTSEMDTLMDSTTIGAGSSSSSIEVILGTYTQTGDITNEDATVTDSDTSVLAVGVPVSGEGIPTDATVASITNSTTFELSDAATATTGDVTLTHTNTNDYFNVYLTVTGEADASSATLNIYSSGDGGSTWVTTPHYTTTISGLSSATKTIVYRATTHLYPLIKVEVINNATESGATDDIQATIVLAGYDKQ